MSDVAEWKVRGPVRTCRRELAEWDPSHDMRSNVERLTITYCEAGPPS